MRRNVGLIVALAVGVVTSLVVLASVARTAPEPRPYGPPIGPRIARDNGAGELLIAVVGGVFSTAEDARRAGTAMRFGDVQGYYVVPVDQFQGLIEQAGGTGTYALVSVFRTDEGAQAFAEFARGFGNPAIILPQRVTSLGGVYAGLGQEEGPGGSGPLQRPIPESLP